MSYAFNTFVHLIPLVIPPGVGHRGTGGITYMSFARYSNSAFVN